mmetsp:Transcript_7976/g.13819  ORF Transcript_7976/g.13819 Transcript_7976/m.13819 type:complete len:143 (+) Transcript_7976:66-494(+)
MTSEYKPVVPNESDTIEKIRSFVGKHMKVQLIDGRIVVGRFSCTDDTNSLVLSDSYEIRNVQDIKPNENTKVAYRIGTVLLLDKFVKSIAIDFEHDGAPDPSVGPKPIKKQDDTTNKENDDVTAEQKQQIQQILDEAVAANQ